MQKRGGAVSQATEPSDDSLSIGINLFLSFSFSFPVVDGIAGIYSATWAPHCYRMVTERLRERIGTRDDIVKRVRSFGSHVLPNPSASIELRVRRREKERQGQRFSLAKYRSRENISRFIVERRHRCAIERIDRESMRSRDKNNNSSIEREKGRGRGKRTQVGNLS